MAFSINDILNNETKKKTEEKKNTAKKVHMIHFSKLKRSDHQFYSETGIEELAEDLLLGKGIQQPLLVKRSGIGEYEIIAGHRRRLAAIYNYEKGYEEFAFLPCIISEDGNFVDRLNLILTNKSQRRNLSAFEKMKELKELEDIIHEYEKTTGEKIKARILRKELADVLGISETKVANLQNIDRNLSDQGKKKLENGDINISVATELAGLPEEKQDSLLENENISVKDVKELKKNEKNVSESDTKETGCDGQCFFCNDSSCNCYQIKRTYCIYDKDTECNIYNSREIAEELGIECKETCCTMCEKECGARCNYSSRKRYEQKEVENVSESDTLGIEEDIEKGQLHISDYKYIDKNGFSRKEKINVLEEEIKSIDKWIDAYEHENATNVTRMIINRNICVKEALSHYIKYLRSDIQE